MKPIKHQNLDGFIFTVSLMLYGLGFLTGYLWTVTR